MLRCIKAFLLHEGMMMSDITVEKPTEARLAELGVRDWPTWSKEVSTFPWYYDAKEVAYIVKGEVTVTPKDGAPVRFGAGDLVTFAKGLDCVWEVTQDLHKHYQFE